eukprot:SAG22_NODE_226_length_14668_cov_29.647495_9_plen_175_part_00
MLIPYINTAEEAEYAVSCAMYPTAGTRSVYFPQRSMNAKGLLGYAGVHNKEVIVALQVETASCIENMEAISAVNGVDILFLGNNDLCMSMGLFEKYEYPLMYTSPELNAATEKLIACAKKNGKILGMFQFGTVRARTLLPPPRSAGQWLRLHRRSHCHCRRRGRAHAGRSWPAR